MKKAISNPAKEYAFAVHEAGHTVALFIYEIKFKSVSLKMMQIRHERYIDSFIIGVMGSEYHKFQETPMEKCFDHAICCLAGATAEIEYSTRSRSEIMKTSDTDIEQAKYLCEKAGVPFKSTFDGAIEFVHRYEPQINHVACSLLKSQKLSYKEVQKLIEAFPVKRQSSE
jgi:hypothetical protein